MCILKSKYNYITIKIHVQSNNNIHLSVGRRVIIHFGGKRLIKFEYKKNLERCVVQ